MSSTPRCSVVLPTFDRVRLLPEAIASVLAQTADNWELIVVDDGSGDGTEQVVSRYLVDSRVRYVRQAHAGPSAARNRGCGLARGELVCFLDSDDRYLPTTLATHLAIHDRPAETGLTIGAYQDVDEADSVVKERRPWAERGALTPEGWLFNCYGMPGSVMLRRDWFERVEGFDSALDLAEDWDLFLRLAFAGCPMAWAPDVVCRRRLHRGNSTRAVALHRQGSLRALENIFRTRSLPASTAALERPAKAWLYAAFARRAASSGEDSLVRENLRAAADFAIPSWERQGLSAAPRGFPSLVEGLVADVVERERDSETDVGELVAQLSARWDVGAVEIWRALARVEMSRFFDAVALGARREAGRHLRVGLTHDLRWLANRAVLAFLVRQLLRA